MLLRKDLFFKAVADINIGFLVTRNVFLTRCFQTFLTEPLTDCSLNYLMFRNGVWLKERGRRRERVAQTAIIMQIAPEEKGQ